MYTRTDLADALTDFKTTWKLYSYLLSWSNAFLFCFQELDEILAVLKYWRMWIIYFICFNTLPYFPSSNHPHTQTPSPIRPWAGDWGWRWLSCGVTGWDFWSLNTVFHQHGAPGPSVGFQSESMSAARGRRISNTWIPFPANNESPVVACSLTGTVWVWCHSTWAHPFFTD